MNAPVQTTSVDEIAEQLINHIDSPAFATLLAQMQPLFDRELVAALKERVTATTLRNARWALQIAEVGQAVAALVDDPQAAPLALWGRANALHHLCHYSEALECYQQAETTYAALGCQLEEAILQLNQVAVLQEIGDIAAALQLDQRVRVTCAAIGPAANEYLAALEMNIGLAHHQVGNLGAALAAYERGRALFAELHDTVAVARMDINRAYVLEEQDNFRAADALLTTARTTLLAAGQAQEVARADLNLGALALRRGHYQQALKLLEAAYQGFAAIPIPAELAVVDLYRSFIYRDLNLLSETITLADTAAETFREEATCWQLALALHNQATGYWRLGNYATADALLTEARHLLLQHGAQTRALLLDVDRAELALALGQPASAGMLAESIIRQPVAAAFPAVLARLHLLYARRTLQQPDPDLPFANEQVDTALQLGQHHHLSHITISAHHLLGQICERQARPADALDHYGQAVTQTEHLRTSLLLDELQLGFMEDKLSIYADTVRLCQQLRSPMELCAMLNLFCSAPLLQLPALLQNGTHAADPVLQQQLSALREQWHWYQSKLDGVAALDADTPGELPAAASEALYNQLHRLETEIADLTRRARVQNLSTGSDTTDTNTEPQVNGTFELLDPATAQDFTQRLQRALPRDGALLHYFVSGETLHVLLVRGDTLQLSENLAPAQTLHRMLRAWRFHLRHVATQGSSEQNIQAAKAQLQRLYQTLLAPLAPELTDIRRLFVVLPPDWHDLPLAACYDGEQYLVERHCLTYLSAPEVLVDVPVPSSATELTVSSASPRALVVGCSDGARLTHTLVEAEQIAAQLAPLTETTLLLEEAATLEAVQHHSQQAHIFHCATHAVFRPDNPLFSWLRLADNHLTLTDLYIARLPQRPLVVLSACETGRGQPRGGGLLGMGRGFLAAGATGLIVGLWQVEDQATARLMQTLYSAELPVQLLHDPAQALCLAQRTALRHQPHPFYWAGYRFMRG